MDETRAAEIIAAYGGDAARWPADERDAVLRLLATVPALAGSARSHDRLDAMIDRWATAPVAADDGAAAMVAARVLATTGGRQSSPRPLALRWMAGGGIAAALVAGVMFGAPHRVVPVPAHHAVSDDQAFASIFTPTLEEDGSI